MKLLALAMARYPNYNPMAALTFFESDRQRAGLGALKERSMGEVTNNKRQDFIKGAVLYRCAIDRKARYKYPHLEPLAYTVEDVEMTFQLIQVPPVFVVLCLAVDRYRFSSQSGRSSVASDLWKFREKLQNEKRRALGNANA